ncbi:MAG: NAD-dependent epimerase/dehydratase family protein [Anaerolineales bacterium]|nr:NAD-dependent epimerase/dehydratase family protein [Anaerolineales bacterium]
MTKVLVTGAAGFIGSHVVDDLLEIGYDVVALDDLSGGYQTNVSDRATFVSGSVTDHDLIDRLFETHKFDYVYHLAAYAAEGLSHFIRRFNYNTNLIASVNLINAAILHEVKCFVFTSSIAVYGANQVPMTEDLVPSPEDPYGVSKLAVELDLRAAQHMFGLPYIIFRPHNVYGERQNIADRYRNVVGIFMNQILKNEPMSVFGDGEQSRAFSYVKDVSPIIARSVQYPHAYNQVYNVGADVPYTVNYLAQCVAEAMGVTAQITHLPPRNEVVHAYSSHDKVKEAFDIEPQYDLRQGLARMAAWVREHGARSTPLFQAIEVAKNMPPSWLRPVG